jgi:uncharacterized protein YutE (UPF0331/DUF86 family)
MTPRGLRKAEQARLRRRIREHLADFSNQYEALEFVTESFGTDFNLGRFKEAFNSPQARETYRDVHAVERAAGRVQGYLGDLAKDGVRLTGLPREPEGGPGFQATQAFEALREAGLIDGGLCADLVDAQKGRSRIEHEYVRLPAGQVHRTVSLIHAVAPQFMGAYRPWIEPYLD